jgi:hypothetical protein
MRKDFISFLPERMEAFDHLCTSLWLTLFLLIFKLESIEALEQFMLKHRKDYVDLHRTTEQERDSIENEVSRQTYPQNPFYETL